MRIALPVWEGRISPVFDTAANLLVVDADGVQTSQRREETLHESFPPRRAVRLSELGVEVLICGAISQPLAAMVAAYGIQVVPFVSGEVNEVLTAYVSGRTDVPDIRTRFGMPGCCGRRGRFGRGGRGRGGPWQDRRV